MAKRSSPAARSVLDLPRQPRAVDPALVGYASRFLAEKLPEGLRPTASEKRLQVALVWGEDQFLDVADVAAGQGLTIGEGHGADLLVTGVAGVVPFVRAAGDGFQLLIPASARASVSTGGRKVEGGEVAKLSGAAALDVPVKGTAYTLGLDDRAVIDIGSMRLIARYTRPQPAKTRPFGERIDVNFLSTVVILLLVAAAFVRMIAITDFGDLNLSDDLFKNKDRFAKYIAKAEQKEKPKFEKLSGVKEGAKPKDEEGKFGKKDAQQKEAAPSKKGAPVVDVDKREEDRKKVMKSGLIALLGGDTAGATSNVFGPGGIGTGLNNALGGINGAAGMGDANGVGGLGARGGGAGGGGTGLGIGGLGGHGSGRGRGGSGEFDLGGTGKSGTRFVPGKTTVVGGLTADEVGRIIRRHWNEIKYCYEKELSKDPNLAGKVSIAFVIDPVGDVGDARVSETTLNNGGAEQCMVSNVRRWKFPAPRGGGTVEVNYPFIFQAQ
ncbi:MAG: hypothetical protein RL199_795 [Pseudomonadota bacterium]